jgi:hypothetical protein
MLLKLAKKAKTTQPSHSASDVSDAFVCAFVCGAGKTH